jgi:hypothetical protein
MTPLHLQNAQRFPVHPIGGLSNGGSWGGVLGSTRQVTILRPVGQARLAAIGVHFALLA